MAAAFSLIDFVGHELSASSSDAIERSDMEEEKVMKKLPML